MEAVEVDLIVVHTVLLRSEGEQASSYTGAMRVPSPPPLIASPVHSEAEEV